MPQYTNFRRHADEVFARDPARAAPDAQNGTFAALQRALSFRFRQSRFRYVERMIGDVLRTKRTCRILDIGGEVPYWKVAGGTLVGTSLHVTLLNLYESAAPPTGFSFMAGDGTDLGHLADNSFDIVHSNSVIEHVGSWAKMAAMAGHVRRLAPKYYVQTPNFWFPFEPHARLPLFHWMPEQVRYRTLMRRDCGFFKRSDTVDHAMRTTQDMALLDKRQVMALFPDARIHTETILGLTKSIMAVRD